MVAQPHATYPWLSSHLSAAADGLFCLWRAGYHRRKPRHVGQGAPDSHPGGTRRNRRLAQPAVDGEDGVRPARRQRSDFRLAAAVLHPDRGRFHCLRDAHAGWRGRRMDRVQPGRSPLHSRRDADRGRDRNPGRRGGRDVDRGRIPRGRGRECSPGGRDPGRAGHGSGPRPPCARHRNPCGGRIVRMARPVLRP